MTELDPARIKELLADATHGEWVAEGFSVVVPHRSVLSAYPNPKRSVADSFREAYSNAELAALSPDLATAWLASQERIAALEIASRALVAKLVNAPDRFESTYNTYIKPYFSNELDALIAVLKSSEGEG